MKGIMETIKGRFNSQNLDQGFVMMRVSDINTHGDIANIFHVKTELVDKIAASMMEHGYDTCQPLIIGKIRDIGDYLSDGHTRLEAAKKAGLAEVPIIIKHFDTLEDAQHYTYARQAERRNLTDEEILNAAKLLPKKQTRDGSGRSVEKLSKELGVSASTLVHAKTVAEKAGDKVIEAINKGEMTINQAYKKVRTSKPKTKAVDEVEKKEFCVDSPAIDDTSPICEKDVEMTSEIKKTDEAITVNIEDILRLLMDNKELNAINLILAKYHYSISTELLLELNLSKTT